MNVLISLLAFGISFIVLLFFVDFICYMFIGISPLDYTIDLIIRKMTNEMEDEGDGQ